MAKRPSNRLVRKAIRKALVPQIEGAGFEGKYGNWRRIKKDEAHFLTISSAKYGGAFGIAGAWGKLSEFGDAEPTLPATDFDHRAAITRCIDLWRLDGTAFSYRPKMFDYELIVEDAEACEALVAEAASALPELLAWFDSKQKTEGLVSVFDKLDSVPNPDLGRRIARSKAALGLY